MAFEDRVLVLAPSKKDALLTSDLLADAGVKSFSCADISELCTELELGASAVLLPEESIADSPEGRFQNWLVHQPQWSDMPVLVMARPGADSASVARAMDLLGNVTVLERPMRLATLVSVVRTALKARQKQYQIRDHLAEREKAETELRAAHRRKDEFLAVLAHELRNPLAPIRNALDILKLRANLEPGDEEYRSLIERQIQHMVRLVDDLLEVSRITRGKIQLREEILSIRELLASAIETSRPLIDEKMHCLRIDIPESEHFVQGDPIRLAQIFLNLLNNAAKYTDPQGLIQLTVQSDGSWIEIAVEDNGLGVEQEMLPRIFEMFAQIERGDRSLGGLGIGLTLVKSLVEMHRGEVFATSPGLGLGSRFVVRLPEVSPIATEEPEAPKDELELPLCRFLVVDDNRDAADILSILLRSLGAEVRTAYGGPQALDMLDQFDPDVVLLDIGMPEMTGYDVVRRARQRPNLGHVTFIALTGWGQEEDRRRTREAGFYGHLVKPVELGKLAEILNAQCTASLR